MANFRTTEPGTPREFTARFNPVFYPVNCSRHRYHILKGSAGSGKSVDVAQDYIVKLMDTRNKGANLLVLRKAEASNSVSTYSELVAAAFRVCGDYASHYWRVTSSQVL